MNERQFALFMYMTLSLEARKWTWVLKDIMKHKAKYLLNNMHKFESLFINEIEGFIGKDAISQFEGDAAIWGDCLKLISEKPVEDKQNLYLLMKTYSSGESLFTKSGLDNLISGCETLDDLKSKIKDL